MGNWFRSHGKAAVQRRRAQLTQQAKRQDILLTNMNLGERKAFNILVRIGIPFYTQLPIGYYFGDFVGADRNFVIEIDGSSHLGHEEYDEERDKQFARWGFDTYRLWSTEVTEDTIRAIVEKAEIVGAYEIKKRLEKASAL